MLNPADWIWLITSFVYFVGIANAVIAWAAIFRMTGTTWTATVNRIGHAALAFVPVAVIMLVVMLIGARYFMPWVAAPMPEKELWLNLPFLAIRQAVLLGALWLVYLVLVRKSLIFDARRQTNPDLSDREAHRLNIVAVAALLMYVAASSVVAIDFIMSLAPKWISTMFPPYFFCTSLYAGLAVIILVATALRNKPDVAPYLTPQQFQDLGNLLLGFSLFDMGLFFAQYLTIWYENLPEETFFIIIRYLNGGWPLYAWTAFALGYAVPFGLLQSRYIKRRPRLLSTVAVMVLVGVAIERYVLVAASFTGRTAVLFPWTLVAAVVLSLVFAGCIALFLRRYPGVSSADEDLPKFNETRIIADAAE